MKETTRDGFAELIAAIEAGQIDVVVVRDIDRLTRNLANWGGCKIKLNLEKDSQIFTLC